MALGKQVPDKTLLKSVTQKIAQRAAPGSKIVANVSSGLVTLSGVLAQDYQRSPIISAISSITGVRRVVDMMTITPPRKRE